MADQLGVQQSTARQVSKAPVALPKLLAKMKANPRGDWTISDIETCCRQAGLTCTSPTRGSHHKISSPSIPGILTVPHNKPIKPPYIKSLVGLAEAHLRALSENGEDHG